MIVKDKNVEGPKGDGLLAPLLKGVGPNLEFKPPDAPLPPGWYGPDGKGGSSPKEILPGVRPESTS